MNLFEHLRYKQLYFIAYDVENANKKSLFINNATVHTVGKWGKEWENARDSITQHHAESDDRVFKTTILSVQRIGFRLFGMNFYTW